MEHTSPAATVPALSLDEVLSLVSFPCHPLMYPIQVLLSSLHQKLPFQVIQSDGLFSAFILLSLQHHLTRPAIPVHVLSFAFQDPLFLFSFCSPLVVMSQYSFLALPFLSHVNIGMLQAHPVGTPIKSWLHANDYLHASDSPILKTLET